jgi:hypothetical protein
MRSPERLLYRGSWDYKRELILNDKAEAAEFARDVLAFHNTDGGVIVVGVTNQYKVSGIATVFVLDTKQLRDKIRQYVGEDIDVFQDSLPLHGGRCVWLIFIPKNIGAPKSALKDGPIGKGNKKLFIKGDVFFRDQDETRKCVNERDLQRLFTRSSLQHLVAYNYEIDEPYFRLLNPNCEKFIGRGDQLFDVRKKLMLRHPIVTLDGLGGVGKTAIAIEVLSQLYREKTKDFIFSISAKNEIWAGEASPVRSALSSLAGFLKEFVSVCPGIEQTDNIEDLKQSVVKFMTGLKGLILVDNLESVTDANLFNFLSEEVPEPVKVLVTSRVDKKFGGITVSIPAMTDGESKELLVYEMSRFGYEEKDNDEAPIREMISLAGGLPLAVKWIAQIVGEQRSAQSAAMLVSRKDISKKSLLSFCFEYMYGALSETAKDAACLIPYLGLEWRISTVSILLDIGLDAAWSAITEISEKGLIYLSGREELGYVALPLTKEFLALKWDENALLNRRVKERITETFTSPSFSGALLELSIDKRMEFLNQEIPRRIANRDFDKALKLVELALGWRSVSKILFLKGRVVFETGNMAAGLSIMRRALVGEGEVVNLPADDLLFYTRSLFLIGGQSSETEACDLVVECARRKCFISVDMADKMIRCSLSRGNHDQLIEFVSALEDDTIINYTCQNISHLLGNVQILGKYHSRIERMLKRLMNSTAVAEEDRKIYSAMLERLRTLKKFK